MTDNPLRIVHILSERYVSSSETTEMLTLVKYQRRAGHEAHIFLPRDMHGDLSGAAELRGLSINFVGRMNLRRRGVYPVSDLQDIAQLRRIASLRPDVVHVHGSKEHWMSALFLKRHPKGPILVRTKGTLALPRRKRTNCWLFGQRTDLNLPCTEAMACHLREELGAEERSVLCVPGMADFERFQRPTDIADIRKQLGVEPDA